MVVEIDMERSENVRRWWPFLRDRRIDEYDGLTKRFFGLASESQLITDRNNTKGPQELLFRLFSCGPPYYILFLLESNLLISNKVGSSVNKQSKELGQIFIDIQTFYQQNKE